VDDAKVTLSSNLKTRKTRPEQSKLPTEQRILQLPYSHRLCSHVFRMFGRTIRLEPATGSRRVQGDRNGGDRPVRSMRGVGEGRAREFSTMRPTLSGFMAVKKPVQLTQINPIVGRRMFGLAASMVLKRRLI